VIPEPSADDSSIPDVRVSEAERQRASVSESVSVFEFVFVFEGGQRERWPG